ncbi:MAG TPA: YjbQ family protein, partial [bacterium (Candidatus Stahlbacteria)]|nr:YjbQ family protein [Candidatus Stahlbacteria bacterium]
MVETKTINLSTGGMTDIVDITDEVAAAVREGGITSGIACVFLPGSTGGITTIEYEPGLIKDLPEVMERMIPAGKGYHHDATWGDGNGFSHLRSALIKTSLTIPFVDKKLLLGTWQQ